MLGGVAAGACGRPLNSRPESLTCRWFSKDAAHFVGFASEASRELPRKNR